MAATYLDRYYLKKLLQITVSITLIFCGLVLLAQSLRFMDFVLNRGAPMGLFLQLMFSLIPRFLLVVLPLAVMTATIVVYHKALSHNEIVILQAAGKGTSQLLRPIILAGFWVAAVVLFVAAIGLPYSQTAFRDLQYELRNGYAISLLQAGEFTHVSSDITVYVAGREGDGTLKNLVIYDARTPTAPVSITAEKGQLTIVDNAPRLAINNGTRQQLNRKTQQFSSLSFDQYVLDLGALMPLKHSRKSSDQEKSITTLLVGDAEEKASAYSRLSQVWLAVCLPILAGVLLLNSQHSRRGYTAPIIVTIVTAIILWIGVQWAEQIAITNSLLGIAIMYLSPIIVLVLAGYLSMGSFSSIIRTRRQRNAIQ